MFSKISVFNRNVIFLLVFFKSLEAAKSFRFPPNTTLRVAVEQWFPHMGVNTDASGRVTCYGPMAKMLDMMAQKLEFNYVLSRPPDGSWGAPNKSGFWNGMIGMVRRDEVDIAMGPFIISEPRADAVQFSTIFFIDYFTNVAAREKPKADPWGFLKTFTPGVWAAIVTSIFSISFMIVISTNKAVIKERMSGKSMVEITGRTFLEQFGFLMQQGLYYQPKSDSIRLVLATSFILNIIIVRSFSSSLTALLAVRISYMELFTLKEVIRSDVTMVLEASTAITGAMAGATGGTFGELAAKRDAGQLIEVVPAGLQEFLETEVIDGPYTLFVEELTNKKFTSDSFSATGICEFYFVHEKVLPSMFGIIGQKNKTVIPELNVVLHRIIEGGFYDTWLSEQIPNATTCMSSASFHHTITEPFTVLSLWVMFSLLSFGLLLSTLTFLCEKFVLGKNKFQKEIVHEPRPKFLSLRLSLGH